MQVEIMQGSKRSCRFIYLVIALSLGIMLAPGLLAADADVGPGTSNEGELMWKFVQAEDAVNANLTKIDLALAGASMELSKTGLAGAGAQSILRNLTSVDPSTIDCITIGSNGTILEVVPDEYRHIMGEDIGQQEHIKRLFSTKRPVGLAYIKTVEGFDAMDFESPVFDKEGCLIGAASVLINSTQFIGQILQPYQPGGNSKIWAMQPDGLILYETDLTQIGQNPLKSSMFQQFTDLLDLNKRMEQDRSGYGTYEFFNDDHSARVKKAIYWTTVGYQGSEMRLALTTELE